MIAIREFNLLEGVAAFCNIDPDFLLWIFLFARGSRRAAER
jgi:hypothetical protein